MNWRRGLIRIWIFASVIWISGVSLTTYNRVLVPRWHAEDCASGVKSGDLCQSFLFYDLIPIETVILNYVTLAFIPAIFIILLGIALRWIVAGFNK
jgi:hypothetical protein